LLVELEQSFNVFLLKARQALAEAPHTATRGALRAIPGAAVLPDAVASLEDGPEFSVLVEETKRIHQGTLHGRRGWKKSVGNWFRRSGVYEQLAAGNPPDGVVALQSYEEAFSREQTHVSYLAPIEYVSFWNNQMDFGQFKIVRLSKASLEDIFQNRTRALFYKWAQMPTDDLLGYWWLILEEKERTPPIGKFVVDFSSVGLAPWSYTPHPDPVELALQTLVLYPWLPDWGENDIFVWSGFEIPFVLRIDDCFRGSPFGPIPNTRMLAREPENDPDTGEEIGDRPTIHFHFDQAETNNFELFAKVESERLTRLRSLKWSNDLIETGLGFLVKAFFANGVEQLLWHITTIEALFGEDSGGITERLAQRVSRVLGGTEAERKEIRKSFRELYDTRSELVHGTSTPNDVQAGHLRTARQFARSVMLWFVRWIDEIVSTAAGDPARHPKRRDLLRFLDLETDSRNHIKWLAESMPPDFPRVLSWL
jgi:Apea-like HEPN